MSFREVFSAGKFKSSLVHGSEKLSLVWKKYVQAFGIVINYGGKDSTCIVEATCVYVLLANDRITFSECTNLLFITKGLTLARCMCNEVGRNLNLADEYYPLNSVSLSIYRLIANYQSNWKKEFAKNYAQIYRNLAIGRRTLKYSCDLFMQVEVLWKLPQVWIKSSSESNEQLIHRNDDSVSFLQ